MLLTPDHRWGLGAFSAVFDAGPLPEVGTKSVYGHAVLYKFVKQIALSLPLLLNATLSAKIFRKVQNLKCRKLNKIFIFAEYYKQANKRITKIINTPIKQQ